MLEEASPEPGDPLVPPEFEEPELEPPELEPSIKSNVTSSAVGGVLAPSQSGFSGSKMGMDG